MLVAQKSISARQKRAYFTWAVNMNAKFRDRLGRYLRYARVGHNFLPSTLETRTGWRTGGLQPTRTGDGGGMGIWGLGGVALKSQVQAHWGLLCLLIGKTVVRFRGVKD